MLTALVFILLFGALQAILLLAVVLTHKKVETYHIIISSYVVVLLMQVTFKVISKLWLWQTLKPWYMISYHLPLLYGPLVLLFTRYYLHKTSWRWKQLLHFVPFLLYAILSAADAFDYQIPAFIAFMARATTQITVEILSIAVYHWWAWNLLHNYCNAKMGNPTRDTLLFVKWFIFLSAAIASLVAFGLYYLYIRFPHYQDMRWMFAGLTVFVYWISYKILQQPALFKVIPGNDMPAQPYNMPVLTVHRTPARYVNSGLREEEAQRIITALHKRMDAEKLFTEPSLTIDTLAEKLDCHRHHLSQVLNDKLQKSFAGFINEKRVEEAKRLLASPSLAHHKISSIGFDAGFNSVSSFNEIFKKQERMTPSAYRTLCMAEKASQIKRV